VERLKFGSKVLGIKDQMDEGFLAVNQDNGEQVILLSCKSVTLQKDTCVKKMDAVGLITLKDKIGDIIPKKTLGVLNVKKGVIWMKIVVELNVTRDIVPGGSGENAVT